MAPARRPATPRRRHRRASKRARPICWRSGVVQDDRMTIHLSRLLDNAPVRDAAVTVLLRGVAHPTTAEADGSYHVADPGPEAPRHGGGGIPGSAGRGARDAQGHAASRSRRGQADDKNSARQLWWWVLNFAVCIGFLWLISRRRKSAQG